MNALDRRHPSQRVYHRNVRIAMTVAALTHAAILALVSVPFGSPRAASFEVLRVVEAPGIAHGMDSPAGPAVSPEPGTSPPDAVEPLRAVDEPVRTVAATEAAPNAGEQGSLRPSAGGGGTVSGSAVGGSAAGHDEGTEVFYAYDIAPRALRRVQPDYSPAAKAAGLEGTVVVNVNIDDRGRILRAWVAQADAADVLVEAALDAAYQFEFAPGTWRGEAVRCTVAIPFQFHLNPTVQSEGN